MEYLQYCKTFPCKIKVKSMNDGNCNYFTISFLVAEASPSLILIM